MVNVLERKDFTEEQLKHLQDQGVSICDWDYGIIVPLEELEHERRKVYHNSYMNGYGDIAQEEEEDIFLWKNITLDYLLFPASAYKNRWYMVEFDGKIIGLGVRYHS